MMRRGLVVLALAGSLSCQFAVDHPPTTAGLVAGSMALGTCELASDAHGRCFAISGIVGVGLGVITVVALWLGYDDSPASGPAGDDRARVIDPANLPPVKVFVPPPAPPPVIDAGVPDAPLADAGAVE